MLLQQQHGQQPSQGYASVAGTAAPSSNAAWDQPSSSLQGDGVSASPCASGKRSRSCQGSTGAGEGGFGAGQEALGCAEAMHSRGSMRSRQAEAAAGPGRHRPSSRAGRLGGGGSLGGVSSLAGWLLGCKGPSSATALTILLLALVAAFSGVPTVRAQTCPSYSVSPWVQLNCSTTFANGTCTLIANCKKCDGSGMQFSSVNVRTNCATQYVTTDCFGFLFWWVLRGDHVRVAALHCLLVCAPVLGGGLYV